MKIVKLYLGNDRNVERTARALSVSHWLQETYGMVREKDYDWFLYSAKKEVHFVLHNDEDEAMESIIITRWAT